VEVMLRTTESANITYNLCLVYIDNLLSTWTELER